ncbi:MAG: protease inhibitor I42 family protein [Thermodesulfobacteriota bacterium]
MRGSGTTFILAGFLAALFLGAALAAAGPVILHEKDRGHTFTMQVGEKLLLYLRNPGSGGYNTNPPVFDPAVLKLASQKKLPPESRKPPRAGDFGQLFYEWEAIAPGQTEIIINIYRPWEKKAPEEFWRVKVKVE